MLPAHATTLADPRNICLANVLAIKAESGCTLILRSVVLVLEAVTVAPTKFKVVIAVDTTLPSSCTVIADGVASHLPLDALHAKTSPDEGVFTEV